MKITDVKPLLIDNFRFVLRETDEGITGLGESGAWAFLEASASAVELVKRYLIGQDPLKIECGCQFMVRCFPFPGRCDHGSTLLNNIRLSPGNLKLV